MTDENKGKIYFYIETDTKAKQFFWTFFTI